MAATITVTCPECDTTIKASAEVAGKKVRCKSCGGVFVAKPAGATKSVAVKSAPKPAAKSTPKPAKEEAVKATKPAADEDDENDGKAYGLTETDLTPRCPHCANELESADSKVCLHCGYNTETRQQVKTKKVEDVTSLDVFMWLLPGILCVLGVIGLIVWDFLYCLFIENWVDTDIWWGSMICSGALKFWWCIASVFFMYALGRFAVRRLIFDRVPPEIETK